MIEKGYAQTSLTDLAKASGMSVSHLLYYFPGKEAVLVEVCDDIGRRFKAELAAHQDEPPEERIHILVDDWLRSHREVDGAMRVSHEMRAAASHHPELLERLWAYSRDFTSFLEDLYARTPRQPGLTAADAAEIAAALCWGVVDRLVFDADLDIKAARRLLRATLLSLANVAPLVVWEPAQRAAARPRVAPKASRKGSGGA